MKLKILVTLLALCAAHAGYSSDKKVDTAAAKASVEKWLALVDAADYEASWKRSSELLRARVPTAEWKDQLSKAREPLGKFVKRELRMKEIETSDSSETSSTTHSAAHSATSSATSSGGTSVIFQYLGTFEQKKDATETVTCHLDKDKHWRVSDYIVR
jgi:hypothetical protein